MSRRNLGRMRHRLTIMAIERTTDAGGGAARSDAVVATVAARIKTIGALEANTYSQLQERVTHKAMIRARTDLKQGQTVYWLNAGATELAQGVDDTIPDGAALYVVTTMDADPDGRPGEFMDVILREGGNL